VAALWLPAFAVINSPSLIESLAGLVALFTVPLTFFVGAPLYWIFRRRVGFWWCASAGIAIGIVGVGLFWLMTNPLAARNWAPLLIATGLISSLLFWVVGIWRNSYVVTLKTGP
jgi:hypothetical protein